MGVRSLLMRSAATYSAGGWQPGDTAPVPAGAYRYFRVKSTANNGGGVVAIGRLILYALDGNGKLYDAVQYGNANGGEGYASSTAASGVSVAAAFSAVPTPGQSENCWSSNAAPSGGSPQSLIYDFKPGKEKVIVGFAIIARANNGFAPTESPKDFTLEGSNDFVNWTVLHTVTNETSWTARQMKRYFLSGALPAYTGSPWGAHRYWRYYMREDDTGASVAELRHRTSPGGSDLTPSSSTYSTTQSGLVSANAFDNNTATIYSGSGSTKDDWIALDMGSAVIGAEIKSISRPSFVTFASDVIAYQFADSLAGPWTTAIYTGQMATWTATETRIHTDPLYI